MKFDLKIRKAAVLVSGILALSAAATGVAMLGGGVEASAAAPNTFDEFLVGSWRSFYDTGIASYEEQLEDLARSGINFGNMPLHNSWASVDRDKGTFKYTMTELNEMYKKYNSYFLAFTHSLNNTTTIDAVDGLVDEVAGGDLDRCIGYYVKDEPSAAQFASTAQVFNSLWEKDNTRFPFVNLFPNYAGATNLGGSYADYVQGWVDAVGAENMEYLAYDHYPFTEFEDVRASYFSDMETIRKVGYENGKMKTVACTQLGSWNGMRRPTPDMAKWNNNSFLAYGFKGITHFCWVSAEYRSSADGGEGMKPFVINTDGTKTDLYEPMQKVNWQTRQLGIELMKMDVAHAYHAGTVAQGAEALPKSFVFQPTSANDNLIFSLAYGKNGQDIYVMVFSNEIEGNKKNYDIKVDLTSGVQSLTRYVVDPFDTLPDYMQPLPAPGEEQVDVSGGTFSVELGPGDIMLYKLNGDVTIKEPLKSPRLSMRSGTYLGEQKLELYSGDEGAEIYYTTDGSYPSYTSSRYTGPIRIGNGREFGQYIVKAIAIRGSEISDAVTGEYIISDGSENVALGKPVKFTTTVQSFAGSAFPSSVTDGTTDPWNVLGSPDGQCGFAIVDLGAEYTVDKLIVKAYHDWRFEDVVLQLALDEDFTEGVYTVFNNDTDNSVGAGTGTDGVYQEKAWTAGHTFEFSPQRARYIRFHNCSVQNTSRYSLWEEIQAYTAYNSGTDLLENAGDWEITGGGTWEHTEDGVSQTGVYNTTTWDRSYTYTEKKFKNFILEGKFTMQVSDSAAWGYVGFGLYKPNIGDLQSNIDQGFYACVEPRGRVLLWNGEKPELGPEDANITGFSLNSEFTLRVISIGDTVSVSVNGKPIMYVRGEIFDREAGYISIHSGLIPLTVSSVTITELDGDAKPLYSEQCVKEAVEDRIAVPLYTEKAEVLNRLPATVRVKDTEGTEYDAGVKWSCPDYDCATTGFVSFIGELIDLPHGLVNPYRVTATMNVYVQPKLDKTDLENLVTLARGLNPSYFTADSFEQIRIKLEAAEDLLTDPFLAQSDLGVGVIQLYGAIYSTSVSTVDKTALSTAIERAEGVLFGLECTEISRRRIESALEVARAVYESPLSTPDDVATANATLDAALDGALVLQEEVGFTAEPPARQPSPANNNAAYIAVGVTGGVLVVGGAAAGAVVAVRKKKKKADPPSE